MCNILKTTDHRAKRIELGTRSHRNCTPVWTVMKGVCLILWVQFVGHSVYFAKFSDGNIFKRPLLPHFSFIFSQALWKVWYSREGGGGGIQAVTIFDNLHAKLKKKYRLKSSLTQDHMLLKISKWYSYTFYPILAKIYEGISYYGGIQAITFLGNQRSWEKKF